MNKDTHYSIVQPIVNRKLSNSKYHYGCKQCKVANAQGHA